MPITVRLIGDVHGKIEDYADLLDGADYSVQLGDMGFAPHYAQLERLVPDWRQHIFIPGNHDDYRALPELPHAWMHFGAIPFLPGSFYIRGAYSIDQAHRTAGRNWFPEEELSAAQAEAAFGAYVEAAPRIMLSHDCPEFLLPWLHGPVVETWSRSSTRTLLQACWEAHPPLYWFFGHHHKSWSADYLGCTFRCLDELETFDLVI